MVFRACNCITHIVGDVVSTSTEIKWKTGKNLVQMFADKRKAKGNKRASIPDRTFFEWFLDNSEPSCDEIAEVRV